MSSATRINSVPRSTSSLRKQEPEDHRLRHWRLVDRVNPELRQRPMKGTCELDLLRTRASNVLDGLAHGFFGGDFSESVRLVGRRVGRCTHPVGDIRKGHLGELAIPHRL